MHIDWLNHDYLQKGGIGLTILPGRKDNNRSVDKDLRQLKAFGVDTVIPLITDDEFNDYGVSDLLEKYKTYGFEVHRLPIMDQLVSSEEEMNDLVRRIENHLAADKKVLLHCVGGLGRSGLVAASYLKYKGLHWNDAIASVRKIRGPKAVETRVQEDFVESITFDQV